MRAPHAGSSSGRKAGDGKETLLGVRPGVDGGPSPGQAAPHRPLWGLRARLFLLVGLAVLPVLGAIGYTARRALTEAKAAAQDQVRQVAQQIGRREAQRIRQTQRLLAVLAHLPQVRSGNATRCHLFLAGILARSPQYANFALIAPNARVLCSAVESQHPVDPARHAFFQRVFRSRQFSLGNYQIGQITGLPVLVAAYPLLHPRGQVTALLIAALKLNWLNALPDNHHLPAGATLVVLDSNYQTLFHYPHEQGGLGRSLANTPLVRDLRSVAGGRGRGHTGPRRCVPPVCACPGPPPRQ
ncbi:MAG: cache domain-containing protein [Acidiferrobacteraceae bacterium]